MRFVSSVKASVWRVTDSRHLALNAAMPYVSMSFLPLKPSSFSTAISTGRPWQSQLGLAGHVVAAHGAEAGEDVLEDACLDVVGARHAVGGGRALVEHPLGAALGLLQGLGEDLLFAPEVEHGVLERGQVDLGGHLAVRRRCHQRASSGGLAAFRPEGRELCHSLRRLRRAPAVPPSLAPGCAVRTSEPPHWGREAGSTGRGWFAAAFFRRLRGDLHVALAPGLPPSPGRSGLRTSLLVPIHAFRSAQCTAPRGQRPTAFTAAGAGAWRGPGVTRMAKCACSILGTPGSADYPAGSWAQRMQVCRAACARRANRAVRPVAAGLKSIYRPSTIRVQDHNM